MLDPKTIKEKLGKSFTVTDICIEDDTALHAGHREALRSGGGHFRLTIVSPDFEGLDRLARHRAVYAALKDKFQSNLIHALAVRALTPREWGGPGSD